MGMAHWATGERVLRIDVPLGAPHDLWIPTVLDAGVTFSAFGPSDPGTSPCWGRTRDLRNDRARLPELLRRPYCAVRSGRWARTPDASVDETGPPERGYLAERLGS